MSSLYRRRAHLKAHEIGDSAFFALHPDPVIRLSPVRGPIFEPLSGAPPIKILMTVVKRACGFAGVGEARRALMEVHDGLRAACGSERVAGV